MNIWDAADRMVQVGIVKEQDFAKRREKVEFPETGIVSDWLWCVGGMPEIGEEVLVLYQARRNSEGFVLGKVGPY